MMRLLFAVHDWVLDFSIGKVEEEYADEDDEEDHVVTTGSHLAGPEPLGFCPPPRDTYQEAETD